MCVCVCVCVLLWRQLRKMQDMIAKMQAEMAKQGTSAANSGEAVQPTTNGSAAQVQGSTHWVAW